MLSILKSNAEKVTITQSGFSFSPNDITIKLGDELRFVIIRIHTATEITQATWIENGNTPKVGGFNFGAGTNSFTPTLAGTIY